MLAMLLMMWSVEDGSYRSETCWQLQASNYLVRFLWRSKGRKTPRKKPRYDQNPHDQRPRACGIRLSTNTP